MKFLTNALKELKILVSEELSFAENFILSYLSNANPFVLEVASYLMHSGGKRIRAVLALAFSKMGSVCNKDKTVFSVAALELIHNATLLHDDVVDEGTSRRGEKSVNKIWGNKESILVGDALLAMSFKLATETQNIEFLSALSVLASELIEGEIMELNQNAEDLLNSERYFKLIKYKTASLFELACSASALLSNQSKSFAQKAAEFGKNFGLAYQIADDVFDYIGSREMLGKDPGSDFIGRKITLPVILCYKGSTQKSIFESWISGEESLTFPESVDIIQLSGSFDASLEIAQKYASNAIEILNAFADDYELNQELINCLLSVCESFLSVKEFERVTPIN